MSEHSEIDGLLEGIVTTADCMSCKMCCIFHEDDKVDAPLFTEEQRNTVQASEYGQKVTFTAKNNLWQVDLVEVEDGAYVCPILDKDTHGCNARDVDNFDCRTWPFYIMKEGEDIMLTLSPDCPAANARINNPEVQQRVQEKVLPFMLNRVQHNSGLIADFRPETSIITQVQITKKHSI